MKKDFVNIEFIEGYLFNTGDGFNALQERITGEQSKNPGTKYISGDINIAVDEEGLNVITVHYNYVTEITKNGKQSSTYKTLKTLIDNPDKTWIKCGKENCYKVRCSKVSLAVNDFIANDGTKIASLRNENGFISIVNELTKDMDKRHKFEVDMLITRVTHVEANPDKNIDNDFVSISGCIFGYGPVLIPANFTIKDKDGMNWFENLEISPSNRLFTKVWGRINSLTKTVTKTEESAFGAPAIKEYSRSIKEYEVTGTSLVPYDYPDETTITEEDINKMNQDRQIKLAEIESRFNKRKQEKNTALFDIPDGDFPF